ncbi:unnamed protein product [Boreogadus saida]
MRIFPANAIFTFAHCWIKKGAKGNSLWKEVLSSRARRSSSAPQLAFWGPHSWEPLLHCLRPCLGPRAMQ